MHIVAARVELNLPSRTLKEKRQIVKSLLARAQRRFNVAAAEVDLQDVQGSASLAFVTVSVSAEYAHGLLQRLDQWIEQERPDVEIVAVEIETL